jgi:Major Facilitator Superfamily
MALDRGLEDDWFASPFIVAAATICALAFVLMIPWELSRRNPMIDLRTVATRQFGTSFVVMLAAGGILLATTQYLPQLVQQNFGYTATWAGLVLTPGGIVTVFMMPLVGQLTGKVQPRYLIAAGAAICAVAMYDMTKVNGDLGFWFFATSRIYIGLGLPLVFLPIIAASYDGVAPGKTDMASALINVARNTGGSVGISLANNVLAHREQFHQTRLVELANPSTTQYQNTLNRSWQLARASPAASVRVDWSASPDPGELPRLCRRVLDPDLDLARRGAARARLAQGQARWRCRRALNEVRHGRMGRTVRCTLPLRAQRPDYVAVGVRTCREPNRALPR